MLGIAEIAGLIGAVGGLFAAIAAFISAKTAKQASDHAAAIEKRAQVRELSGTANEIIAETLRIDGLAAKCKMQLKSLFSFSGGTNSSRQKVLEEAIEAKQKSIGPIQSRAREISESRSDHKNKSEDEMNTIQSELDNDLIQVSRIKEELQEELASYEAKILIHQEKVIKGT